VKIRYATTNRQIVKIAGGGLVLMPADFILLRHSGGRVCEGMQKAVEEGAGGGGGGWLQRQLFKLPPGLGVRQLQLLVQFFSFI
jgi:hypothetical protein